MTFTSSVIVTLLCAILCLDFSTQDKLHVHVNMQEIQKMRQEAAICGKETGVPAAVLKKIIDWPLDDDEPTKKFFHCVCFNCGYIKEDGHMIIEPVVVAFEPKNGTHEEYINILNECNEITRENPLETVYGIGGCFHEKLYITIAS